ncbi:hypothetical protein LWI29_011334 [Acer saccharum]|uniref:proline--tRNA ligase n=1 Tax=Acer saccharum TaxID=4024 RepID=A0AA39SCC0_ACESA|nr:hypothetical protein LWI29_011334 [Acer saccharum]
MALKTPLLRPLKSPSPSLYSALKCKHFYQKPTNSNSKNEFSSSVFNSSCRNPEALDRFLKERCRSGGGGIIIQDHKGHIMAASSQKLHAMFSPQIAEARTIRQGLQFAKESGLVPSFLESDVLSVIQLISSHLKGIIDLLGSAEFQGRRKKVVLKETRLGLSHKKDEDFGKWYSEEFLEKKIGEMGVDKCMFPLFVSKSVLNKEKNHIAGFEPEAFIPNTGRGIQGATSHCLGQNFSKKEFFDIKFHVEIEEDGKTKTDHVHVWQNSWAYSTRSIGVMVMVHGDEKGLVLPPKVTKWQVIVIPVPYRDANTQEIFDACAATIKTLRKAGIRAEVDKRDHYTPGWKYLYCEMKGVPLRIEIGPKDLANNQVRAVRRDNGVKMDLSVVSLVEQVKELLGKIQESLFDSAKQRRDACIQIVTTWDEFAEALGQKKLILAPWCDKEEVEKDVKERTKGDTGAAKTLCTPFDQPEMTEGTKCFASGKPAKKWTYWGRSY